MQNKQISVKRLNEILDKTISTISGSKNEVFEIVDYAREDCKKLEIELKLVQAKANDVLTQVDKLEVLERKSRDNLSFKNKEFNLYDEAEMKEAYDLANNLRLDLILKREEEKNLLERRSELELRLKNAYEVFKKAESLSKQIAVATEYLMGNVENIVETVDQLSKKHYLGIKIIEVQEEERHRLARDIHDGPAQSLANLIVKAELCEKLINIDIDRTKNELNNLKTVSRATLKDVRKIIYDLRPMSLDDLGLIPTLEKYISIFEVDTNINISLKTIGSLNNVESAIQVALFRITQESLSNIRKHSFAKSANIIIEGSLKNINLSISDDGVGFDVEEQKKEDSVSSGFGLISIKERVQLLNGTVNIISKKGSGTKLTMSIPLIEGDHQ